MISFGLFIIFNTTKVLGRQGAPFTTHPGESDNIPEQLVIN